MHVHTIQFACIIPTSLNPPSEEDDIDGSDDGEDGEDEDGEDSDDYQMTRIQRTTTH